MWSRSPREGVAQWGIRIVQLCLKPLAMGWAAHVQSRLCEAQNRKAAAGLRDGHRDGGHAVLRALGFLEKRIKKASAVSSVKNHAQE